MSSTRKEPRTNKELATEFQGLTLAGLGVRTKTIAFINFYPYAVGMYIDVAAAERAFAGISSKEELITAFMENRGVKTTFYLDMTREIKGATAGQNIADRLKTRGAEKEALDTFVGAFAAHDFKDGSIVTITIDGGEVTTNVMGTVTLVKSALLAKALFHSYLHHKDPVDQKIVDELGSFLLAAVAGKARGG